MSGEISMRRVTRLALSLAVMVSVAGCGMFDGLFSSGDKGPKLPGKRLTIMEAESQLEVDDSAAATPIILPEPVTNAEWTQPGGHPSNVNSHLSATGFNRAWRINAGSGSSRAASLIASPVVADGRIYVLDASSNLRAFNAQSGSQLWRVDLVPSGEGSREGFGGGVAYWDKHVFVANGYGDVHGIDAATGKIVWTEKIGTPFRTAPAADDGRVFAITSDNQLLCFSATTGEILWRQRGMSESAGILTSTSPAIAGSVLIAPYSSGEIYALRVENGTILWNDALTRSGKTTSLSEIHDIAGRPVVDGDNVFAVSHSGRMVSIDLRTGERVWSRNVASVQMPWVAGDTVFLVTTEQQVAALSRADGRVLWIHQLQRFERDDPTNDRVHWSGPVLVNNRLLLVSSLGEAVLLLPETGEQAGDFKLPDNTLIAPVVANGTIYILTDNAGLVALR